MPLENNPPITPPNTAYISDLIVDWPEGTDYPSDGDDHIRGIKNVLRLTFPLLDGPVNLTPDQLNYAAVFPKDTTCVFYQANAPTNWVRVNPSTGTRMLIITSGDAGKEGGGPDAPELNNKVASHTHPITGSSGENNRSHQHYANFSSQGASIDLNHRHSGDTAPGYGQHQHYYKDIGVAPGYPAPIGSGNAYGTPTYDRITGAGEGAHSHPFVTAYTNLAHTHPVQGWVQSQPSDQNHTHSLNITSSANTNASDWKPRYSLCLLAKRQANVDE